MLNVLISLIGFLLAIGILVTIHEMGHFWVARFFGIKVLRFSVGFGRPFFRWYDRYGTEYAIAAIPLGGYVSLFGERGADIPPTERHMAFSYKPAIVRIAVLLAGPLSNLIFAVFAYWLMFMIGISSVAPVIGSVVSHSAAELAGLKKNQEIISIENKPTPNWEAFAIGLISNVGTHHSVSLAVKEQDNTIKNHTLDLGGLEQSSEGDLLKDVGIVPMDFLPPIVGQIMPDTPAVEAGIKPGDKILAINNKPVETREEISEIVRHKVGELLTITLLRQNKKINIQIKPVEKRLDDGKLMGFIGIVYSTHEKAPAEYIRKVKFGPITALKEAVVKTWNYTILTLEILKKMIVGQISLKHLSGPISIAKSAGQTVVTGIEYFLNFLAVISISLGVLNLLPIPVLDGGHIAFCLWELATGKPVSEQIQIIGLWIGAGLIFMLMILAFYNDIMRI